jgi:hydrogenase nickel incorporation protein HypA/HybF
MHEFSTTQRIVNTLLKEAKKHNAKRVNAVYLIIGKLTFLGLEQIKFAYNILVKNTIMEDSKLHIEEKNGSVKCNTCGYEGDLPYKEDPEYHILSPTLSCPQCRDVVNIVGGRECTIKSISLVA